MASSSRPSLAKLRRSWPWTAVRGTGSIFLCSRDSGPLRANKFAWSFFVERRNVEAMSTGLTKFFIAFTALALIASQPARAGSIGDFFKALGNSIAHPGQKKKTPPPKTTTKKSKTKENEQRAEYPPT